MGFEQADARALALGIGAQLRSLAQQAASTLEGEVQHLISQQIRDENQIEHALDALMDFCYDSSVLSLFKELCRYYYTINPAAATQQIVFYREMWDTPDAQE